MDEAVQHGEKILVTGVFGQDKEDYYIFYGRPVNPQGSETEIDEAAKNRSTQLI